MKKVGILSLYYRNPNCGAQLQALALCKIINKMGYDAEQICYDASNTQSKRNKIEKKIKQLGLFKFFLLIVKKFVHRIFIANSTYTKKSNQVFHDFEKTVPHSNIIYTTKNIHESLNNYDIFVCGSDQVWNWSCTTIDENTNTEGCTQPLDVYMLKFAPEKKKIAYAASIACPFIPDNLKEYYKENINQIDYVSIREKDSLNLFDKSVQSKITAVLDPTLLLSSEAWSHILSLNNSKRYSKYIFCYFLDPSKEDRNAIRRISKLLNMPIIIHPNINNRIHSYDKGIADFEDYGMGPKEFVQYIKNADLVLTNSFHASVFSMQFHTPFYIFKRESKVSMHSRLTSFVKEYHFEKRILKYSFENKELSNYLDIDWLFSDEQLSKNRELSYLWLNKALEE